MKILSGIYTPTNGTIEVSGQQVQLKKPADAKRFGIEMVHQELNLAPDLTVAENIYLGHLPKKNGFVDRTALRQGAQAVLDELGAKIDPMALVGELAISQQQLVEIAKAYSSNPRIIVLDEPTSSLSEREAEALFKVIRKMKANNIAVIYISHRLKEVMDLADHVSILRDGEMVHSQTAEGITPEEMIKFMVGRYVENIFPKVEAEIGETVLKVHNFSRAPHFKDISLHVRAGEILGLTGLVGAGRSEFARAVFGLDQGAHGEIEINGSSVTIKSPSDALKAGIAYVPEDRKGDGIIPNMQVRENISLSVLKGLSRAGSVNAKKDEELARSYISKFSIIPPDPKQHINLLSGGNQQKAVISKWLATNPSVLILDEPTRGVDVGAKAEIHRILGELVSAGMALIVISSELPEIMGVCDRVIVMHEGRANAPIERAELSEEYIMALATGEQTV